MSEQKPRWHSIFPTPISIAPFMQPVDLADLIRSGVEAGKDYVVVDVRRTDFETAYIKGAVNLPAHSFYQTLLTIIPILAPVKKLVFHCNSCSDGGRGPRTAGWYLDELKRRGLAENEGGIFVLEGGLKAWMKEYAEDESLTVKLPALNE